MTSILSVSKFGHRAKTVVESLAGCGLQQTGPRVGLAVFANGKALVSRQINRDKPDTKNTVYA